MTPNATSQFYFGLNAAARAAIDNATSDPGDYGRAQQQIHELTQWRQVLVSRPDCIALERAISEATVGLFLLASGLYRSAFMSLRLFLELALAGIHFSVNRLELAEWLRGDRDVHWATLIDRENGVLSDRYADGFFPELRTSVQTYNAIASKTYRELSEFVHGNHHTWGAVGTIAFDRVSQDLWFSHFSSGTTVVGYALCLRFLNELQSSDLAVLSGIISEGFAHVEPILEGLRKTN